MREFAVRFLMACRASNHRRAQTVGTALHSHRMRFSAGAAQRLVAGNMAILASGVPQDHGGSLKRLE
jgi:hypothetical protein